MAGINQFLEGRGKDIQPVNLDGITSETEMNQVLFDHTQQKLRVGGYISPTEGAIKPVTFGNNIEANITQINDSVLNYKGPTGFDDDNADYKKSRYLTKHTILHLHLGYYYVVCMHLWINTIYILINIKNHSTYLKLSSQYCLICFLY